MEVASGSQTASGLEHGKDLLARGAGIRGRLEDDEVSRAQPLRDLLRGRDEDPEIGLALA